MLKVAVSTQWNLNPGLSLKIMLLPIKPSPPRSFPFVGWSVNKGSHRDVMVNCCYHHKVPGHWSSGSLPSSVWRRSATVLGGREVGNLWGQSDLGGAQKASGISGSTENQTGLWNPLVSLPDQPFRRTSLSWRKKNLEVLPWRLGHCGTSQLSCFYSPVCQQGTFCHALFWACILNDKLPGVYNFIS